MRCFTSYGLSRNCRSFAAIDVPYGHPLRGARSRPEMVSCCPTPRAGAKSTGVFSTARRKSSKEASSCARRSIFVRRAAGSAFITSSSFFATLALRSFVDSVKQDGQSFQDDCRCPFCARWVCVCTRNRCQCSRRRVRQAIRIAGSTRRRGGRERFQSEDACVARSLDVVDQCNWCRRGRLLRNRPTCYFQR